MTTFLRLLDAEDKRAALDDAVRALVDGHELQHRVFEVAPESFRQLPGAPFAYWVSEGLRRVFTALSPFEDRQRAVKQGLATADDFRFVRTAWEVAARRVGRAQKVVGSRWWPFAKGGEYSPFHADVHLVIDWEKDGASLSEFSGSVIRNPHYYLRPGLTWPLRTQSGLALRAMPAGCIFGHKGPAAFVANDSAGALLALLALTNSRAFRTLVDLQMAFGSYEVGVIQRTPVPDITASDRSVLADLARRAWSLKRALDTAEPTSHAFVQPALLQVPGATLFERATAWSARVGETEQALAQVQAQVDERCFDLYGFAPEDRKAAVGGMAAAEDAYASDASEDEGEEVITPADATALAADLVGWLVGIAFGRFDVRLATGERTAPGEPQPFDPLPVCSPGMLTDEHGLPATVPPAGYPVALPPNGILVEDTGLEGGMTAGWDIVRRVQAVLEVLSGAEATDREAELCSLLGVRDLRTYLSRPAGFFSNHLSRYSKSRRKAPIYWPLSTASGSYTLWIYYPRLTEDTLYEAVNEHVAPKVSQVERRIVELQGEQGSAEGRQATRITRQLSELTELRNELVELRKELLRVAGLPYKPDLNDGVQITAAPLWRLFRLPKWQKILKATWSELENGKYDWAHLALSIWPDRVHERCKEDRSIAIAHGLEALWAAE